uniref:Complex III subunit 9 n=1 Tax=Sinocyclocheilus anshuiensis TaxID=1608454 RepID=A0A671KJV4_9TELE
MALARSVYNLLFRRTSTFAITIMVGAVVFERVFDQAGEAVFDNINRGVSYFSIEFGGFPHDPPVD